MNLELESFIDNEPKYRRDQVYRALFDPAIKNFDQISTLPKDLRRKLHDMPWLPFTSIKVEESLASGAKKALLRLADGEVIETVLMKRLSKKISASGDRYTVCLSSQVGCPMGCIFCATGKLGFKRNLSIEEIIGQFRYWQFVLWQKDGGRIDNIVLMGQGEPLLNYIPVRDSLNLFLKYTDIGPRKITLSTAGVLAGMKQMVSDPDFPSVRFALSLHSAIPEDRRKLMPAQPNAFFDFFVKWAKDYHNRWPSRTHFIGIEYVFISGVNDTDKHLVALKKLLAKLGRVRINLIPYNYFGDIYKPTSVDVIKEWQKNLLASGYTATIRVSQGQDISAACGQLRNIYDDKKK